jgi:quercetin dioxygenase-like cupin family protein
MEKKNLICIVIMLVLVFMLTSFNASAQDIVKANPKYTKVLTDTLGVRIIKVTLAPGEELAMHSHPVWMIYVIEGGQLTGEYLKAGSYFQGPPVKHTVKNTGTTTCVFLDIEIKDGKK